MVQTLSSAQARYLRLRAQGLHPAAHIRSGDAYQGAHQIVSLLGGVQAQDADSAILAVGIRNRELVASQIEDARLKERSIVRTWGFRGTLHLLATADLGWLLSLLGPELVRRSRRRYAELALSQERYTSAVRLMDTVLSKQGPMTRAELRVQLAERGISLEGQALYHALRRAGLEGVICFGPDKDGQPTYVLLDEWVPTGPPMEEEEALTALTRRYLLAYGPAGPEDLAAWSGVSLRKIRTAFDSLTPELLAVEIGGSEAWMLKTRRRWLEEPVGGGGVARLLPGYDPYLLGYRSRDMVVSQQYARRIHPGGGVMRSTVIRDGRAVGIWRSKRRPDGIEITVEPFQALSSQAMMALESEAEALGSFYGQETILNVSQPAEQNS